MITGDCSSHFFNDFFAVFNSAIEGCCNALGSILGLLRHTLYSQFTYFVSCFLLLFFQSRISVSGEVFLSTLICRIARVSSSTRRGPSDCGG